MFSHSIIQELLLYCFIYINLRCVFFFGLGEQIKMLPFQSYYGLDQQEKMSHEPPNFVVNLMDGGDSTMSSASKVERKSEEACRSHKEAERRRRQRINAHLSTLRTLLPNTTKVSFFRFCFCFLKLKIFHVNLIETPGYYSN